MVGGGEGGEGKVRRGVMGGGGGEEGEVRGGVVGSGDTVKMKIYPHEQQGQNTRLKMLQSHRTEKSLCTQHREARLLPL